jgi:hypothetical protein
MAHRHEAAGRVRHVLGLAVWQSEWQAPEATDAADESIEMPAEAVLERAKSVTIEELAHRLGLQEQEPFGPWSLRVEDELLGRQL